MIASSSTPGQRNQVWWGIGIILAIVLLPTLAGFVGDITDNPEPSLSSPEPSATSSTKTQTQKPSNTYPVELSTIEAESIAPVASTIQPLTESTVILNKEYKWDYAGYEWTYTANIPQALYNYYAALPRPPTQNYSVYITHPSDDLYIEHLVDNFKDAANEKGFTERQTLDFAISFVQNLPYTSDDVTTGYDEYPRYPIETLVDYGGDCEDTSILMAAIVDEMGYGTILINPPHHMAVGVLGGEEIYGTSWTLNGKKYFYLETTSGGRQIGEIPPEYQEAKAKLYELIPIPILLDGWGSAEAVYRFPQWYIKLEVTIENQGTATAKDISVQVAFDAGNNQVWNPEKSPTFNLPPGYKQTVDLYLSVPFDEHTRLIVTTVQNDLAILRSYSKWFDT